MSSIKDVALSAGVSPAAVSLVLNDKGKGQISEENQKRILEAAKKLNYRPSEIARSLLRKKSKILDLIIPAGDSIFSTFFFLQIVNGIWKIVQQRGYKLILNLNEPSRIEMEKKTGLFEGTYTDGSLVLVDHDDPELIVSLKEKENPFVLINTLNKKLDCVTVDYEEGALRAVEHLIKLGHKNICCIRGDLLIESDRQRLAGYKKALKKYNLNLDENLIVNGSFSEQKSFEAIARLLNEKVSFSAVFAVSDIMAIGAMEAVSEAGLNVPGDIAVVGFDDIILSTYVKPSLTTIKIPMVEIGEIAAKTLIDRIEKEKDALPKVIKEVLKTKLIIRESCGAVKKNEKKYQ